MLFSSQKAPAIKTGTVRIVSAECRRKIRGGLLHDKKLRCRLSRQTGIRAMHLRYDRVNRRTMPADRRARFQLVERLPAISDWQ
jgi:hypothetical protein